MKGTGSCFKLHIITLIIFMAFHMPRSQLIIPIVHYDDLVKYGGMIFT
jgi:hypothetical protein